MPQWFKDKSKRPLASPCRTPKEVEKIVCLTRQHLYNQNPACGIPEILRDSMWVILIVMSMCYEVLSDYAILSFLAGTRRYLFIAIACAFIYALVLSFLKRRIRILPESILMTLWLAWTVFTAIEFHVQPLAGKFTLTSPVFRYPFFCVLFFIMINSLFLVRSERTVLFGFAVGGMLLLLVTLSSGRIGELDSPVPGRLGREIVGSSNQYAYLLLFAIFACTYYAFMPNRAGVRMINVLLIVAMSALVILSGSRKAVLGELVFFMMIFYPKYSNTLTEKWRYIVRYIVVGIVVLGVGIYVLPKTYIGERFEEVYASDMQKGVPFEERFAGRGRYYVEAVGLVYTNPILGVGLNNFRYYDEGGYASHSDYVALITETGIPGFVLYFSAYLVVLLRLRRSIKTSQSQDVVWCCHFFKSLLITVLLVALGRWNYNHVPTYILLALAGEYATRATKAEATPLSEEVWMETASQT